MKTCKPVLFFVFGLACRLWWFKSFFIKNVGGVNGGHFFYY